MSSIRLPTNLIRKMTEQDIQLLIDNNIPEKVVFNTIFVLEDFDRIGGKVADPSGVSVALSPVDITKRGRKRKGYAVDERACP